MTSHHFILVLSGVTAETDGLEDALYEANCDDALIFTKNNSVYLEFDREAVSLEAAVISAINDAENTPLPIVIRRVDVNSIVSMSDIAQKTGISRQLISMYVSGKRGDGHFPAPIAKITSSNPLWNWTDVARWLASHQKIDPHAVEDAVFIDLINDVLVARSKTNHQRRLELIKRLKSIA